MSRRHSTRLWMAVCLVATAGFVLPACVANDGAASTKHADKEDDDHVRNVILFIGDGMGVQQISLLNLYRRVMLPDAPDTSFERMFQNHHVGLADTYMLDGLAVDSATSATQMACGIFTRTQVIGLDASGYPCHTVLEEAYEMGKATGLITDTRVTHATPAAFAAKQVRRSFEPEIAHDLIAGVSKDKVQIMLGGGARHFIPQSTRFTDVPGCENVDSSVDGSSSRKDPRT